MPRQFAKLCGLLLIFLSCSQSATAQEEKWTHYGVRPLGMGNAYVAVADDYNALFYNPAGLARLKTWTGDFLHLGAEISKETIKFIGDAQDLGSGSAGNTEAVLDLVENQSGKVQHFAMNWTPNLIFPNFGFALGIDFNTTLVFHRYPTIDIKAGPQVIIPLAFAFNMLEDRLSLGFGIKGRFKGGLDHTFSIQDIEAFTTNKDDKEFTEDEEVEDEATLDDYVIGGSGYGADIGLLFTPVKTMEPTLGISITDLGGTPYNQMDVSGEAVGKPKVQLPSVNVGLSFKPYQTANKYFLVSSDIHSMNQPYSFSKKLNFGTEFGFSRIIKLQMGLHQGYLTAGFQFDVRMLELRFATYSEEMGSTAGTIEDRRYALQLKLLI